MVICYSSNKKRIHKLPHAGFQGGLGGPGSVMSASSSSTVSVKSGTAMMLMLMLILPS